MARYARIASGVVAEVVELPDDVTPLEAFHPDIAAALIVCSDASVSDGYGYDGKVFTVPPVIPAAVPQAVSSAQAKIQLSRSPAVAGGKTLLDDVTTAVKTAGGEVQIWFSEARSWERSNPYVASLSSGLKLTDAQVDQLFAAAAAISA